MVRAALTAPIISDTITQVTMLWFDPSNGIGVQHWHHCLPIPVTPMEDGMAIELPSITLTDGTSRLASAVLVCAHPLQRNRQTVMACCELLAREGTPDATNSRSRLLAAVEETCYRRRALTSLFRETVTLSIPGSQGSAPDLTECTKQLARDHEQLCRVAGLGVTAIHSGAGSYTYALGDAPYMMVADAMVLARWILQRIVFNYQLEIRLIGVCVAFSSSFTRDREEYVSLSLQALTNAQLAAIPLNNGFVGAQFAGVVDPYDALRRIIEVAGPPVEEASWKGVEVTRSAPVKIPRALQVLAMALPVIIDDGSGSTLPSPEHAHEGGGVPHIHARPLQPGEEP